ncbi:MAG: type I-E CRISPR-associated protein Cas6/Cse3/CasE [Christensenella sp.]|nr:type I-E CRISPR-associated protein Cas6/Cse3/CasE [Christensenella sp.]
MYLSRIELDEKNRETMRALASPQIIHGAVEKSIGGERERNLWRIDRLGGKCFLLILSHSEPNLAGIAKQFGWDGDAGESKDYDRLLAKIEEGQRLRFRLRANPIRSISRAAERKPGKVHAHVTTEQQRQWLIAKAEKHGFSVAPDEFDVLDTRWYRFEKHRGAGEKVTIRTATFEGMVTITDADLFREALTDGIGKAKAYGCGLLTVIGK